MRQWLRDFLAEAPWPGLLAVAVIYAVYFLGTSPKVEFDAKIFMDEASLFSSDGFWTALLRTFPTREPGYPLFLWSVSKLVPAGLLPKTVVFIQFCMLFSAALWVRPLARALLTSLWARRLLLFNVLLSPALLFTAQTLYSETFAMFLFVSWVVFFWKWVNSEGPGRRRDLFLSGLAGGALIFTRAAFLHVVLASLSVLAAAWWVGRKREGRRLQAPLLLAYGGLLMVLPVFWMARNQVSHGVFNMAEHAGVVLKGRYEKSLEPYTLRDAAAGTLNAVSESACEKVFGACGKYNWQHANVYGHVAEQALRQQLGISSVEANKILFRTTVRDILFKHPARFTLFGWFELWQLAYFETLGTGAVTNTCSVLSRVQSSRVLRGLGHFGLSTFYLLGVATFLAMWVRRKNGNEAALVSGVPVAFFFTVYSMATTTIRYTFVVAPLYILFAWIGWEQVIKFVFVGMKNQKE